ncbi:hypothetical protein F53441_4222 [Fusarium austroafricanum]|uniref:Uncharacterized protein n=1 Tax=Fusarium austroafricanum TaxID=2364996 RepID=A0A8H4KMD3_9HYPO|nr:hypothetical protein F53441_4222 [Fusarium austroafricanum]
MEQNIPDAVYNIIEWVKDDSIQFGCGHIQGPSATNKTFRIPFWIAKEDKSDTAVITIVPSFKKVAINEQKAATQKEGNNFFIFHYRDPYKRLLFVIDADPDYSAPFAIAFAATTTRAGLVSRPGTMYTRIVTMSWEGIHPVTRELFDNWDEAGAREFIMPDDREPVASIAIPNTQTSVEATLRFAQDVEPNLLHL